MKTYGLHRLISVNPSLFVYGEKTVDKIKPQIDDLLCYIKKNPMSENENTFIHFRSEQIITVHKHGTKRIEDEIK